MEPARTSGAGHSSRFEKLRMPCGRKQLQAMLRVAAISGSSPTKPARAAAM